MMQDGRNETMTYEAFVEIVLRLKIAIMPGEESVLTDFKKVFPDYTARLKREGFPTYERVIELPPTNKRRKHAR